MSNPLGINQYTRNGAGALRTKSGKFYHGTQAAVAGAVKPGRFKTAYATSSLQVALSYGGRKDTGKPLRVLIVSPGAKASMFENFSRVKRGKPPQVMAASPRSMSVIGHVPTLHKPSRK